MTMVKMGSSQGPKALNAIKRQNLGQIGTDRPTKRLKALLEEDDTSDEEKSVSGNAGGEPAGNDASESGGNGFKVNQEFARRFEHNKKREELHRRE